MKPRKREKIRKILPHVLLILFIILICIFLTRLISEKQLDDVNPQIQCNQHLLDKADVYYIIPIFNNKSIADNPGWCEQIKAKNKKLALHGVYHTYKEFNTDRDQEYLDKGIQAFQKCFNQTPAMFKPSQIKISKNNKKLIKNNNLKLNYYLNEILHKSYHCENSGKFSNKFIDFFNLLNLKPAVLHD